MRLLTPLRSWQLILQERPRPSGISIISWWRRTSTERLWLARPAELQTTIACTSWTTTATCAPASGVTQWGDPLRQHREP